jgi:small redox-active disulfide protein 2
MKVQVLGTGCARCNQLYAEAEKAIARTGVDAELSKVEKLEEIMKFGVALVPALVVNGEVKSSGKVPGAAEIDAWLKTSG